MSLGCINLNEMNTTMTIVIDKKHIYGLIAIVLAGICILLLCKSCEKADYETTAKNMKLNAWITTYYATQILSDYQQNWQSAVYDHRAINTDGKYDDCYEFSTAITWRFQYYTNNGHISLLDSLANVVKEDMKLMEDAPSKFDETQKSFMGMYNDMNTLVSLVKDPKGSLVTFGQRVNELMLDFENKYNETDLKISISEADKNAKTIEIQKIMDRLLISTIVKSFGPNKKAGEEFIAKMKATAGVKELPGGTLYKVIKEGKGVIPADTSRVHVSYEGRLIDGKVFDSSYKNNNGKPVKVYVSLMIPGWTQALTHMPTGSVWEIYVPQDQAYGTRGVDNLIKPFSALVFKLELIDIVDAKTAQRK